MTDKDYAEVRGSSRGEKIMKTQRVGDQLQSFAHSGHAQDEVLLYVDGRYIHIKDVVLEYCHEMINGKMCHVHKVLIRGE